MDKSDSPNYEEVRGHVSKRVARRFKGLSKELGLKYGEALELALKNWIQEQEKLLAQEENEEPQTTGENKQQKEPPPK